MCLVKRVVPLRHQVFVLQEQFLVTRDLPEYFGLRWSVLSEVEVMPPDDILGTSSFTRSLGN